ncbi:helix-turn-helix domain-containing protein [Saccharopolyspora pogona]|uniref:helix-turn-helix domain-containing protein n=1 Tax=Saccharopolyspora pogona TaxID=333966 RepID=UPI0016836548|nr:helix-turn-helix domain-containing protein [Saccharopolyspora pogona]
MSGQPRLVSSSELARELGVTRQTVARWVRGGVITPATVTAGGQARFDVEKAKSELREHRRATVPTTERTHTS